MMRTVSPLEMRAIQVANEFAVRFFGGWAIHRLWFVHESVSGPRRIGLSIHLAEPSTTGYIEGVSEKKVETIWIHSFDDMVEWEGHGWFRFHLTRHHMFAEFEPTELRMVMTSIEERDDFHTQQNKDGSAFHDKLRYAKRQDYSDWYNHYCYQGGRTTGEELYRRSMEIEMYVATEDLAVTPLYGDASLRIIIPQGVQFLGGNPGDSTIYYWVDGRCVVAGKNYIPCFPPPC